MTVEAGASLLQSQHGLNINSARDYISDYRQMLQGKVFQRAMSAPAIDYFLTRIQVDRGAEALQQSLKAVWQHIEYYEGIRKISLKSLRKVAARHEEILAKPRDLVAVERLFAAAVQRALNDAPAKRQHRLQHAAKLPPKVQAVTEVYVRNPDVVAEVLIRANGVCERCRKRAPFLRKKDGEPYLECHHIQLLADGGEDTVENAIAVCPNCHRHLHYGKDP
jgi:5-methylcytosine-specific restriction protein A